MNYFGTSFELIANALPPQRPFYFAPWEVMDTLGKAPDETISKENYLSYQEKMYEQKNSQIFDYGTADGYPQACGPVILDNELIGYMGIMIEDAIPEDAIAANDLIISAILAIHYKENEMKLKFSHELTQDDVLLGAELTDEFAEIFLEKYPPPYAYIAICSNTISVSTLHYVKNYLISNGCNVLCAVSGEHYLYLLEFGIKTPGKISDIIADVALRYGLFVGVSDRFYDVRKISSHRTQALLSVSRGIIKNSFHKINYFEDYYVELISMGILERTRGSSCLYEGLKLLQQSDKTEGTDYIETLRIYLDNSLRSAAVARVLGMHYNSIKRRMERIEELSGLDLKNMDIVNGLSLQLERLCASHKLSCGVSLPFSDLDIRSDYLLQAKAALDLGPTIIQEKVFLAERLSYYIMCSYAMEVYDSELFVLSDIKTLCQYDQKKGTAYLETLECYVHNYGRITATANELFIDRSTLKYRIQKISELLGKDIESASVMSVLRLSIAMYRIAKSRKLLDKL